MDEAQPQKQVGIRKDPSYMDYIQTCLFLTQSMNQPAFSLKVEHGNYFTFSDSFKDHQGLPRISTPLVLTSVDYKMAFNSIEMNAIFSALVDQGVDGSHARTLSDCYKNCSTTVQLFYGLLTIPIKKKVRQGNTISPELFTAALQWINVVTRVGRKRHTVNGQFL